MSLSGIGVTALLHYNVIMQQCDAGAFVLCHSIQPAIRVILHRGRFSASTSTSRECAFTAVQRSRRRRLTRRYSGCISYV